MVTPVCDYETVFLFKNSSCPFSTSSRDILQPRFKAINFCLTRICSLYYLTVILPPKKNSIGRKMGIKRFYWSIIKLVYPTLPSKCKILLWSYYHNFMQYNTRDLLIFLFSNAQFCKLRKGQFVQAYLYIPPSRYTSQHGRR